MLNKKSFIIDGTHSKPILIDVTYRADLQPKPIVIFCHGYKGFKDWGAWNLVAEEFAHNGFFFVKFNFSHNGGTMENPNDFPDLEAFAEDNFSKQLDDLESVMHWILTTKEYVNEADVQQLNLIGHSRGGGIVYLKAAENKQVNKVISWAGVGGFNQAFPTGEKLKKWRETGVYYVENSRTKQQLPHHYQFYQDYQNNRDRFDFKKAGRLLRIPYLIVHAKDDSTVKAEAAEQLQQWTSKSKIFLLEEGNHTFGSQHPWKEKELPAALQKVTQKSIEFLQA